jgi:hypothetical protein
MVFILSLKKINGLEKSISLVKDGNMKTTQLGLQVTMTSNVWLVVFGIDINAPLLKFGNQSGLRNHCQLMT